MSMMYENHRVEDAGPLAQFCLLRFRLLRLHSMCRFELVNTFQRIIPRLPDLTRHPGLAQEWKAAR